MEAELPKGVRKVCAGVFCGPNAAVPAMVERWGCRGVLSCLEERSEEDKAAEARRPPATTVRLVHVPMQDDPGQPLRDAIAVAVDFVESTLADLAVDAELEAAAAAQAGEEQAEGAEEEASATAAAAGDGAAPTEAAETKGAGEAASAKAEEDAPPPLQAPPCVFVHCAAGQSRSVAVCCGFLMAAREHTLDQAVDALGRDTVQMNPGFVMQLVAFEEEVRGEPSSFDVDGFFIQNLLRLFPHATEADARKAYQLAQGNVYAARTTLMRQFAQAFVDRDRIMIDCLVKAVEQQGVPRKIVERVYHEEGKQRDRALARLISMQPEDLIDMMMAADEEEAAAASAASPSDTASQAPSTSLPPTEAHGA